MKSITLLDTSIASTNHGDKIIMEAVEKEIAPFFSDTYIYHVASHEKMGRKSRSLLNASQFAIVGGSSLLSSHAWHARVWKIGLRDTFNTCPMVLMGAGWYQYQMKPDIYSRILFRRIFKNNYWHSVRDSYTKRQLNSIGINNVINTGCPTLWELTPEHCATIPQNKATAVVTTLNTYMPKPDLDGELLKLLHQQYEKVYFWTQTKTDYEYAKKLDSDLIHLQPSLTDFNRLLDSDINLDYVGNRLHAGIRAMQKGRRSIIIEIDNRAAEMAKDFGLNTTERNDFFKLSGMIESNWPTKINLPTEEIKQWKNQFKKC